MDTLDAPLDPSYANRYAYAANNPINYVDPTGTVSGDTILDVGFTWIAIGYKYAKGDTFGASADVASTAIEAVCIGIACGGTGGFATAAAVAGCPLLGKTLGYAYGELAT